MTGSTKPDKVFILGVAGGSGSGKTHFARDLHQALGPEHCEIIYQDNFYIDQSHRFDFDGGSVNFDHPESIDFSCLADCLRRLKALQPVEIPTYDFVTHSRPTKTIPCSPKPVMIVDGILIFHPPELRALFDEMIFFDTPESLRFQRRLERDVKERGRDPEGVRRQFERQVKPMHDQFVEPSKSFAHTRVQDLGEYKNILQTYVEKLQRLAPGTK